MEDDADLNLGEIPSFQMPSDIDIPLKHEQPKTTLEALTQIKNEFNQKVQEAKEKNDSSKKRRYERQLKQFEDAIKATKEGKAFNYSELTVPPGFSQIPLQNGRPILNNTSSSTNSQPSSTRQAPSQPTSLSSAIPKHETYDNDEASDDLLEQLENEIDDENNDDDGGYVDPEDEHIQKQLSSLMPAIKKYAPPKDPMMDDFDMQAEAFKIPQAKPLVKPQQKPSPPHHQQPMPSVTNKPVKVNTSPPVNKQMGAQANKELAIILDRQRLFKEAALKAKQDGNLNVAVVYLRHAKGFDSMITAAQNGLPLDMSNLPVPPQLEKQKAAVSPKSPNSLATKLGATLEMKDDEPISGDRKAVFKRLQDDLVEQIKIATANFKHFTSMGDVTNANRFNQIARESIQDLDALKSAFAHGESVPLYHYEKRSYQTIDCNSDLTDNDLEISIIRAVNLPLPKDFEAKHLSTYVKFEFPYPPEAAQTDKTNKQSGTLNPEYNQTFKLQIQRKQTKFVRLMNRKELKLEIYYKAGLLKGDKLLATCLVRLQPLENTSTIHDAYDLLEGRRQISGKLEVKIRIREPLLHKEVKNLEQKWLIIDKFNVETKTVAM